MRESHLAANPDGRKGIVSRGRAIFAELKRPSAMVENPAGSAREAKLVALTSMCGNPRALRPRQRKYNTVNSLLVVALLTRP